MHVETEEKVHLETTQKQTKTKKETEKETQTKGLNTKVQKRKQKVWTSLPMANEDMNSKANNSGYKLNKEHSHEVGNGHNQAV